MDTRTGKVVVLAAALMALFAPMQAVAGVDVNVSIPLFGFFYEPQPVVVAPPPYGYGYAPGGYVAPPPAPAGAVFHGGYWYLPSGGSWYISAHTGGPWVAIGMDRVPYAVVSGPVLMPQAQHYYGGHGGPSVGISINPWINIGGHGGRGGRHGHGRGHDD